MWCWLVNFGGICCRDVWAQPSYPVWQTSLWPMTTTTLSNKIHSLFRAFLWWPNNRQTGPVATRPPRSVVQPKCRFQPLNMNPLVEAYEYCTCICVKSSTNTFHTSLGVSLFTTVAFTLVAQGGQTQKHPLCPAGKNKNPELPQSISRTFFLFVWKPCSENNIYVKLQCVQMENSNSQLAHWVKAKLRFYNVIFLNVLTQDITYSVILLLFLFHQTNLL